MKLVVRMTKSSSFQGFKETFLIEFYTHRGEVMNGGFGLVLDGTPQASSKAECMLNWDVANGVARR